MVTLCEICGKRPATIHYTEIVNNKMVTLDLCLECAEEKGIDVQKSSTYGLGDLVAELIDGTVQDETSKIGRVRCPDCGYEFSDFRNIGRLGCPGCYHAFEAQLQPLLRHVHGGTLHGGKTPVRAADGGGEGLSMMHLKDQLAKAVEREEYERAAELRDEIRRLESESKQKSGDRGTKE
jgi:protein arginine kinase activator